MTEPVFWQRYFNSRLWERHRASARTSGGKGTAKEDDMFDKYLGEVDDGGSLRPFQVEGAPLT